MMELTTEAEILALKAQSLSAFSGLNLLYIKKNVAQMLNLIGRDGIFDQYTLHDISHIDEMLKILEWLIPKETKTLMTPADWLLIVLSIYFHDLGMVVTKSEFNDRNKSSFPNFKKEILSGKSGEDYQEKIEKMEGEESEKFLYQEFVRQKHAERIKWWLSDNIPEHIGISKEVVESLNTLLTNLDPVFKKDLATICESHHLDDIYDTTKYKLSQPYGNSSQETANMQYIAILLRSADLLHITKDRTPSTAYYIINPSDPISQIEWAKQAAVRSVRSKKGTDKDGLLDDQIPRDTIEVFANFTKEDGFFGLTSYLTYAENEIKKNYNWIDHSIKNSGIKYQYPWRFIDQSNIETDGFMQNTFNFTFDQAKILDLLTGHTLYNDTRVVLRELVQNAIDAVRVQCKMNAQDPYDFGQVHIDWKSDERILTVQDNGTGMTQELIENHLLKAGSSRYQDSNFKKQMPDFSPISRFGIGILSAFMIADYVEITTVHESEDFARHLTLRSVHGKYLIRLLDKNIDEIAKSLKPHGTIIKIKVRPSAKVEDMFETAKKWIVIPNCKITFSENGKENKSIGYKNLKEALTDSLNSLGYNIKDSNSNIKIEEKSKGGVSLAYALKWSEYFREWTFFEHPASQDENSSEIAGMCIEGIRVEFTSPGFNNNRLVAIANATGPMAPKTNVARSNIETTPEKESFMREIYNIYCDHIFNEIKELYTERSFSLTWATQEATILSSPFLRSHQLISHELFMQSINNIDILLIEKEGVRKSISPKIFLQEQTSFWTIDGRFFFSAESLLKEVKSNASLTNILSSLGMDKQLPTEPILCINSENPLYESVYNNKEVEKIVIYKDQRRVDLLWSNKLLDSSRWITLSDNVNRILSNNDFPRELAELFTLAKNTFCGKMNIEVTNKDNEICIKSSKKTFLLPDNTITDYLGDLFNTANESEKTEDILCAIFANMIIHDQLFRIISKETINYSINRTSRIFLEYYRIRIQDFISIEKLVELIMSSSLITFNPSIWDRRNELIPNLMYNELL